MYGRLPFAVLATALACALAAAPAHAVTQRDRVFVASYGSDSNPCTFTQPCRNFQAAVTAVANGGEVTAIDSAGFGPVSISNKSVTITSPAGIEAGIVPGVTDAIDINAPGASVVLRGLTLEGAGSFTTGISASRVGQLEIIDCTVRNFTSWGIIVQSIPAATTQILIERTIVTSPLTLAMNNQAQGIYLQTDGGSIVAALNEVTVSDTNTGVVLDATNANGTIEAIIANSHIDNNSSTGIWAGGASGLVANLVLRNTTVNQTNIGVELAGFAAAYFSQVTITNVNGLPLTGGVYFAPGTTNNAAFSDGTSHLTPTNGTISQWTVQ